MNIRDFSLTRGKMLVLAKCRTDTAEKAVAQKFSFSQLVSLFFNPFLCHKGLFLLFAQEYFSVHVCTPSPCHETYMRCIYNQSQEKLLDSEAWL